MNYIQKADIIENTLEINFYAPTFLNWANLILQLAKQNEQLLEQREDIVLVCDFYELVDSTNMEAVKQNINLVEFDNLMFNTIPYIGISELNNYKHYDLCINSKVIYIINNIVNELYNNFSEDDILGKNGFLNVYMKINIDGSFNIGYNFNSN